MSSPLLQAHDLQLHFVQRYGVFKQHKNVIRAVDGVNFTLFAGETLGLVGESGCGKSSLGKALLNLHRPTGGHLSFQGKAITRLDNKTWRPLRARLQMVFQDPFESLNPRHTVGHILEEPLLVHGRGNAQQRADKIQELIDLVGLSSDALSKYPHEFSGGQRQRIGIARAISLEPDVLVCDEAVSALDVSVQAQILNLLIEIQQRMQLAMLFISHDLSVVRHISDRIAVMYKGRIVEMGDAHELCSQPAHPYTRALLDAVPELGKPWIDSDNIRGEAATPTGSHGCSFAPRCPRAEQRCRSERPELLPQSDKSRARVAACHFPLASADVK